MEPVLCRVLIALFLYTGGITSAPQDASTITYVKPLPEDSEASVQTRPVRDSRIENLPLLIGGSEETKEDTAETSDSQGDVRFDLYVQLDIDVGSTSTTVPRSTSEESTTISENTGTVAEVIEPVEITEPTVPNEVKPRFVSPRFVSKLSYFQKSNDFGSAITNLVERNGKRKFRSRCRCEKIWNCPKLQITVPRCPDEYFMCCF